jgi:hypothetical protein
MTMVFFSFFLALFIGGTGGKDIGIHRIRIEAVEHGFAQWKVDSLGQTEFQWNVKTVSDEE